MRLYDRTHAENVKSSARPFWTSLYSALAYLHDGDGRDGVRNDGRGDRDDGRRSDRRVS